MASNRFSLGSFSHGQRAWLVCLVAGIIIELPPGTVLFLPSALVIHWHVDKQGKWCTTGATLWVLMVSTAFFSGENELEMVVTDGFEIPNAFNMEPLQSITAGRGSLMFYNPGTVMAPLTTRRRVIGVGKRGSVPLYPMLASKVFPLANV